MDRQFAIRLLVRDGIAAKHVSSAFSCSERASLTAVLLSIRLWVLVNATCTALLLKVLTAEAMAGALRPLPRFFRAPPVHAPVRVSSAAFGNCYQQQAQSCGSGGSGAASRRCYRVGRTPRHRALNGRAHAPQKPAREARSSATVSHIAQVPGTQPGDTLLTHPYKRPQAAAHAQLFAWPGATGDEPANSCAEASGKPAWWMQPRPAHVTGEHARVAPVNKAPTPRPAWWLQPRLGAFVVAKRPSWWLEQRPSNVFGLAARWKKTNPVINAKPSWWTQPRPLCTTYGRKPTLATAITAAGPCLRRRLVLGTIVGLPMGVPVDPIPVGSGAEAPLECPRPASGTGPPALDHTDVRPLSLRELVGQLTEYFERTGFHEDKAAKIADLDRILRLVTCAPHYCTAAYPRACVLATVDLISLRETGSSMRCVIGSTDTRGICLLRMSTTFRCPLFVGMKVSTGAWVVISAAGTRWLRSRTYCTCQSYSQSPKRRVLDASYPRKRRGTTVCPQHRDRRVGANTGAHLRTRNHVLHQRYGRRTLRPLSCVSLLVTQRVTDSQGYHQVESLGGDACTLHLYSPPLQHAVAWQNGENLSTGRSSDIGHHYDHGVEPCKLERFDKQCGQ